MLTHKKPNNGNGECSIPSPLLVLLVRSKSQTPPTLEGKGLYKGVNNRGHSRVYSSICNDRRCLYFVAQDSENKIDWRQYIWVWILVLMLHDFEQIIKSPLKLQFFIWNRNNYYYICKYECSFNSFSPMILNMRVCTSTLLPKQLWDVLIVRDTK